MLRANHAVRLGLRAASRNPELSFARALIDQGGSLLAALPAILIALLVLSRDTILESILAARVLPWPMLGGILAAALIAFAAGMAFWAGALPLLAADAEMDRRPPAGNFALLTARGFARMVAAGAIWYGLALLFGLTFGIAIVGGVPLAVLHRSPLVFAWVALVSTCAILGGVLVDLLGRLVLVRAGVFADPVSVAFGKASSLLGARLGGLLVVTLAFTFLEIIAATAMGMATGFISSASMFDIDLELIAIGPRIAAGLAFAAVFAWLEVGRMGALAAIAADAEGLMSPDEPPMAEPVIEALPIE